MVLNMGKVIKYFKMALNTQEAGKSTLVMETAITNGTMEELTKEISPKINLTERACSAGLMVENTQVNLFQMSKAGLGYISGQMEGHTKANGLTENNMDKVNLLTAKEVLEKANGKMVSELNGLTVVKILLQSHKLQLPTKTDEH